MILDEVVVPYAIEMTRIFKDHTRWDDEREEYATNLEGTSKLLDCLQTMPAQYRMRAMDLFEEMNKEMIR